MKSFSKSEALRYGWKTTKAHLGLFLGLILLLGLLQFVTDITQTSWPISGKFLKRIFLRLRIIPSFYTPIWCRTVISPRMA